jgi:hypothetical protein
MIMFGKVKMTTTFAEQFDNSKNGKEFAQALTGLFAWLDKAREEEENESA